MSLIKYMKLHQNKVCFRIPNRTKKWVQIGFEQRDMGVYVDITDKGASLLKDGTPANSRLTIAFLK